MPFLVWAVVNFEYRKAVLSPWAVRVNEWERMFSLWGIRTPEHTKVCAGPLKHTIILHGIHFGLSVFLCIAKSLLYKCLGSILRHHDVLPIRIVPKCIQDIRFDQNPWQNHVYPLLRKQSQNALWDCREAREMSTMLVYFVAKILVEEIIN